MKNAIIELFREQLGYDYVYGPEVARDYTEPIYMEQLRAAVQELNPSCSAAAIEEAITKIRTYEGGSLVQKNEQFTDYLQNGVAVNCFDGREQRSELVRLVDYDTPLRNYFTVANQWTVEERSVKRADIVVFVNGLPLVVVELKSPLAREYRRFGGLCAVAQLHAGDSVALHLQCVLCDERPRDYQGRHDYGGRRPLYGVENGRRFDGGSELCRFDVLFRGCSTRCGWWS